ncbi:MAG: cytochrome c3 family protein [Ardenticatenaceae bacterium]|nr:cytochrome c3 family protein [Ardenticatenaceae bacterium]
MFYPKRSKFVIIGLLLFSLILVACSQEPVEVTRVVEVEVPGPEVEVEVTREVQVEVEVPGPEVEVTRIVEVEPEGAVDVIPFEEMWANSPHNAADSEAFVHWNEDDPQEVTPACARCHSTPGYLDWIGADGTEAGVVDAPAPIGTTVECAACHNEVTVEMDSVVFPSGVEVTGLGDEARCMQCHQGRASAVTVNQTIADAGLTEDVDTVSEDLGFTNIHYYAAAATQYGTITEGGYQYDGKSYDFKNDHVAGYDTCIGCHDPHTLEVKVEECSVCHTDVDSAEDLVDIRMAGSLVDYDGDGDMAEGVYYEIEGMREVLYQAMQAYATEVTGAAIVYNESSYPYFFADTDGSGDASEGDERYASWTARLAKAAYNYQVSLKDPGRYAHGGKYVIQLLYDSIEDLNGGMSSPVDMSALSRIDHGHFAGSEEAFRHWDVEGEVAGSCSRCHSAAGLPLFIEQGVTINQPVANGLDCATCHNDLTTFTRYETEEVPFPSGASLTTGDLDSNLCINCHQGRESTVSVNQRIGELEDDVVAESLRFVNVHYFAAGASLFGTEAKGAYEYTGQVYNGRNEHVGAFDSCIECHNTHALEVEVAECAECHEGVATQEDLRNIRMSEADFDGDGDVAEGLAGEIESMREALLAGMQAYAASTDGVNSVGYTPAAYPYFYTDVNGDGVIDNEEVSNRDNQYNTWTPRLLRAAYNYQYTAKDPGAFAHNGQYIIQVLYDSLTDIGVDTSGMTRP